MSISSLGEYRIKPVYNVGDYGEDVPIKLGIDNLTLQSFILSTSTFEKTTESILLNGTATTVFPVEKINTVILNTDTGGLIHEGNDTAFDRIYEVTPDMTAWCYKVSICAAFALNVSAYTSGNFAIDSVTFEFQQQLATGLTQNITAPLVFNSTLANLTAVGSQVFIIVADYNVPFKGYKGRSITCRISVQETTGTGTRQVGLMPVFPFQAANNIPKLFTESVINLHLHASLDHAYPVMRDQDAFELIDKGGAGIR